MFKDFIAQNQNFSLDVSDVSINEGTKFENEVEYAFKEYMNTLHSSNDYVNEIIEIAFKKFGTRELVHVEGEGHKNQSRKSDFSNGILSIKGDGSILTDVTLYFNKNGTEIPLYLSAKYGSTVSFANIGIARVLPAKDIEACAESSDISKLSTAGQNFLKFFNIDPLRFCQIFYNYKPELSIKVAPKENVDVNVRNGNMVEFLYNLIGYDYILVHKKGSYVHVKDIIQQYARSLANSLATNAVVAYPLNGTAKRIDIYLESDTLDIKLNIRSKTGSIYPTHLMGDYTFK